MSEPSPIPSDGDTTKTRRLVPQHSLTKQDLGSDNARSSRPSCDTPKKPVTRFTREQLISLRKESRILPSMSAMVDIVSTETLSPVCFTRLEPEDVIRIYNSSKPDLNNGRGRAKVFNKFNRAENESEIKNEKPDMWDDDGLETTESPMDLASFAEAALKFRSETKELKSSNDLESAPSEDVVQSLFDSKPDTSGKVVEETVVAPIILEPSSVSLASDYVSSSTSAVSSNSLDPSVQSLFPPLNFGISNSFDFFAKPAPMEPVEWFYRDPQNQVQGPFSHDTMKVWNDDGYFTLDLPIKLARWQQFYLFKVVYPNPALAFLDVPPEPIPIPFAFGTAAPAIAQQIKEAEPIAAMLSTEFAVRPVVVAQDTAIMQTSQVDSSVVSNSETFVQHNAVKSDFAKKLLGIGLKKSENSQEAVLEPKVSTHKTENKNLKTETVDPVPVLEAAPVAKPSKGWGGQATKSVVSLADIQQQQQQEELKKVDGVPNTIVTPNAATASPPVASAMSFQLKSLLGVKNDPDDKGKTAWSTPAVVETPASSLKDIMNEEMNKKSTTDVETVSGSKPSGTSWAAKAKSNAPMMSTTVVTTKTEPLQSSSSASKTVDEKQQIASSASIGLKLTESRKPTDKSEFGGKMMSKDMADWCSMQLKKLKGSDDAMELLQFCMSLKSSVEIREYLSQYLGSSPQVTNFATEFIKFKDEGKRPVAEKQQEGNKFQNVSVLKKKKPMTNK